MASTEQASSLPLPLMALKTFEDIYHIWPQPFNLTIPQFLQLFLTGLGFHTTDQHSHSSSEPTIACHCPSQNVLLEFSTPFLLHSALNIRRLLILMMRHCFF